MEIKTTYSLRDKVFLMKDNKVQEGIVSSIRAIVMDGEDEVEEFYNVTVIVDNQNKLVAIGTESLFLTKEELLKSL